MNDRNFDQLMDAWIDLGPTTAPDRVADAARLEIRTTRQTTIPAWWPPRRIQSMNLMLRYGIAAAVLVLSAAIGYAAATRMGGPSAPVQPSPSASASWVTFTSDRYGYSIEHPADWRVLEQPGQPTMRRMEPRSAGTDTIASATAARYGGQDGVVVIWAVALETGETLDQFTARASGTTDCATAVAAESTTLDGEPAREHSFNCSSWDWIQVTAIHGDRGYVVWLVTTALPAPQDRPINDQFLASFEFTD